MSLLPTISPAWSAIAPRARERVRGIGDASSSPAFDGESGGQTEFRRSEQRDRRAAPLSRIGTGFSAPNWNGPRLKPAFVAQVLGQVMMDARDQALDRAAPAYRGQAAQIPNGVFFSYDV